MFKALPCYAAIIDSDHRIIRINDDLADRLGVDADDAVGMFCFECIHGMNEPPSMCPCVKTLKDGTQHAADYQEPRLSGFFHESTSPIRLEGQVVGCVHLMQDVSNAVASAQELTNARDAAESASEAKTRFLANMSHELRTPLNGVIGMADLLLVTPLSEEQREYAEIIGTSANMLLSIISDLLDLSKIEVGKIVLEEKPFDIAKVFFDAVELVSKTSPVDEVELIVDIDPEIPDTAIGDPERLMQVLVNLLNNAFKFTLEGTIRLSVKLLASSDTTHHLEVTVQDSGIGIPSESLNRIFLPFEQSDETIIHQYGGSGLGLAICKNYVELMGGSISAQSSVNEGSTFIFDLYLTNI